MPVLCKSKILGQVTGLFVNQDRETGLESDAVDELMLTYEGICGSSYAGLTRKSCSRVKQQYEIGTEIRNTRQLSLLSHEEIEAISTQMGVPSLNPQWLGANVTFSGIPDFTNITPSTRLIFPSGASIVVDMENHPCRYPGEVIERHHPGLGKKFVAAALHKRGVTGWVEREGIIKLDDEVTVHLPDQKRLYNPDL